MVFLQHCFHPEQHCFNSRTDSFHVLHTFQTDQVQYSTKYSLVIHNSCSIDYPVLCQLVSGNIVGHHEKVQAGFGDSYEFVYK